MRYPKALATLDESMRLAKQENSVLDMIIAACARGEVYVALGDVAAAARELQAVEPLVEEMQGANSSYTHRVMRLRAIVEMAQGHPAAAIASYSQLIALPDVKKTTLARVLPERAALYLKLGAVEPACADAERALPIAHGLQRDQPYSAHTGRALAALARCQQARAESAAARVSAEQAAINLAKTLGADHPDTQWARRTAQS